MRRYVIGFAFLVFLISSIPAWAHPLDEVGDIKLYDQKQTVTVGPDRVTLRVEMTFYALEKVKVWESIDKNQDRDLSQAEQHAWMQLGKTASVLAVNGHDVAFVPQRVSIPSYYDFFGPSTATITLDYEAVAPVRSGDTLIYRYNGKDKTLKEISAVFKGRDGLMVAKTNRITADSVTVTVKQGAETGGTVMGVTASGRVASFLATYVKVDRIPLKIQLWAIAIAFVLGALHALTPGHGKAIAAGYLIGERGTLLHAVNLGLIITVTHTASVFLLGLAALLLTQYVVPITVIRILNTVSGALVLGFGAYLLIKRWRGPAHGHSHDHDHDHHHDHAHSHSHDESEISWKNLIPLGISGGIVPCVDALAILVVAVSLQKIVFGMILLLSFSAGLAAVLVAAGVTVVFAKNTVRKTFHTIDHLERYLGIASAVFVMILGTLILLQR